MINGMTIEFATTELSTILMNIAMESVSVINLMILLAVCLLEKNRNRASKIFVNLLIIDIAILMGQIMQWIIFYRVSVTSITELEILAINVLFCLDFTLIYFQRISFFSYALTRAREDMEMTEIQKKRDRDLKRFVFLLGVVVCVIYTSSLWSGKVFYFNGVYTLTNVPFYDILLWSGLIISFLCAVIIIRSRKKLGFGTSCIMLVFLFVHNLILLIDLEHSFSFSYTILAIQMMLLYFGVHMRRTQKLAEHELLISQQKIDLERQNIQLMVSQIQPHFLYNTLSVIDYLCGKDVELARTAVNSFAEYLRMNMESIGSTEPVSFEKELEHTKTYLWIEEMRFSDILKVEYDIQVSDFVIPPLSLQPICENAVRHGIRGRENGGTLRVSTRRKGCTVYIRVEDDGIGFDVDQKFRDDEIHIGIENVRKRLQMMGNGRLDIVSSPGVGTVATIVLEEQL